MVDVFRCPACGSTSPVTGTDATRCSACQVLLAEFEITCPGCAQVSKGPEISSPGYCPQCGDRYPFVSRPSPPRSAPVADTNPSAEEVSVARPVLAAQPAPVIREVGKPTVAPQPVPVAQEVAKPAAAASPSDLLARLKQQAAEKLASEAKQTGLQEQQKRAISKALADTYSYLREFTSQVNILKPDYPASYFLSDQVKFDSLTWQEGFSDYRVLPGATDNRLFERVTVHYTLTGSSPIVAEKEAPGIELFTRTLSAHGLSAETQDFKNERGRTVRTRFTIKREIRGSLLFVGDYVAGDICLSTRNVQCLGNEMYRIPYDVLTHVALEELALLVLGASKQFVQRFKRVA